MTRILVTGATGYIGFHVVEALANMGVEVLALSRSAEHPDQRATALRLDFATLDAKMLSDWQPVDAVIHLAWTDGFSHNAPAHIENLPSHVRFVRAVLESGVRQFVGLGTMHEIGYWEGEIDEFTPTNPRSMYGIAKNALRNASQLEAEQAEAIFQWLRPYYILGDDERNQSLFSKILLWEAEGKASFPVNSGTNRYDFIDVKLLARQIAATSLQTEVDGIIDCCSGEAVALREQIEAFVAQHKLKIRPEYGAFPDRPYDSPAVWGNSAKIARVMDRLR
jgi:nucleoside-diphosphate-sugar epimerase